MGIVTVTISHSYKGFHDKCCKSPLYNSTQEALGNFTVIAIIANANI